MKRVFVLRKYIFFRWGKKTLNKGFGRNLPFCRTYVLGYSVRFLLRISVGGCTFGSRVFVFDLQFCGRRRGGCASQFCVKNDSDEQSVLYRILLFVAVSFAFDCLIFTCFIVLQISCNYIFTYLCFNILSSAMRLIISSPPLSHNVFSLDDTLGWLFIFLSYYLVGYRFVFSLYPFRFCQQAFLEFCV